MVDHMTNAPPAGETPLAAPTNDGSGLPQAVLVSSNSAATSADISDTTSHEPTLVDQGGRPLGPRAQQTRARILDATVALLGEKSMRDLRVIDIARRIGSSPATFYQYFKDVEDVVLHLSNQMSEFTPEFVELIRGDWHGREGHERGRRLANIVIDHWDKYLPVLRVRNNASDEGDLSFREVRMRAMMPMVEAFTTVIAEAHADSASSQGDDGEWTGGEIHATVGAMALTSILERLSMYHASIEELGGPRAELVETIATLLQMTLTSKR